MKVCFIGLGSIAKRHIKNLKKICKYRGIDLHIDAFRRSYDIIEGIENVFCTEEELPHDYDVIFITNPTDQHLNTLKRFHDNSRNFFIEKPVVSISQIEEAQKFKCREDSVYYVAAPLRYNAVIQWLKDNLNFDEVISIRSISSSYLPDWRPGQDYRQTYSAHKNMGGGVSIDLIHEWDYLTYLFGEPQRVCSMIGKKSKLEIDSDDYAIYIAEYSNKILELHLDYFGRETIREIQIITNYDTIIGDIVRNKICFLHTGEIIDFNEERDDYQQRELEYFLDLISGVKYLKDSFYHGLEVLKLTQGGDGLL